ncbi:MAG: GFA family protein [Acidobacteriota bacterium]
MNAARTHDGGCTCGRLRYRLTSPPMFVHCCHCTWCQRETGSAFAINALIEADRVEMLRGEVELLEIPTLSGAGQKIARCPQCLVALWSHYDFARVGDLVCFVRVGTLDQPKSMPPDIHIYTASKQPWVGLPPEARQAEGYYSARELWPAESLARREALRS